MVKKIDSAELASALCERLARRGFDVEPLRCVEVGARKPASREMDREPFYRLQNRRILSFEADKVEAERLQTKIGAKSGIEIVGAALGAQPGVATFYVTKNPSCSSLYPPNEQLIDRFPELDVARQSYTAEVKMTTLDIVAQEKAWPRVDFIKMDVQGAELDVLKGAACIVEQVTAIVSEVSFQQIYHGQPLFGDVSAEMTRAGFEFYGFVQTGGKSRTVSRPSQTQTLWGDALFLRSLEGQAADRAARTAIFATLYGALDFADAALSGIGGELAGWFRSSIAEQPAKSGSSALGLASRVLTGVRRRLVSKRRS